MLERLVDGLCDLLPDVLSEECDALAQLFDFAPEFLLNLVRLSESFENDNLVVSLRLSVENRTTWQGRK